jgi:hypothetical protein
MAHSHMDAHCTRSIALLLAMVGAAACSASAQRTPEKGVETKAYAGKGRDVLFEGPWDFLKDMRDPKNPHLIAIAAVAPNHDKAEIGERPNQKLDTGVYTLSLPGTGTSGLNSTGVNLADGSIKAQKLDAILRDKSGSRYVVSLPMPDALRANETEEAIVSTKFNGGGHRLEYATSLYLHYNIASLSGASLAGTTDSGKDISYTSNADGYLTIQILASSDDPDDQPHCHLHSKLAFHSLVKLLEVTSFIDIEPFDPLCILKDPQNPDVHSFSPKHQKTQESSPSKGPDRNEVKAKAFGKLADVQEFIDGMPIEDRRRQQLLDDLSDVAPPIVIFGWGGKDCKSPLLMGTVQ